MYASIHENGPAGSTQLSIKQESSIIAGRDPERQLIEAILAEAVAGRGGLLLLSGEAGIGKTALVEYLMDGAREYGALALLGRCYSLSPTPAFGPWVEILRSYPRGSDLPELPAIFREAELFRQLQSRERLFEQGREFFLAVAATTPLVIVLDDVQLADPDSIDFLRFLVRRLEQEALLVVATYSDEMTRNNSLYLALPFLIREGHAARVELRPLDENGIQALVRQRYSLRHCDERRLIELLDEYTKGNPFYIGELLRALEHQELLHQICGDWLLSERITIPVPPLVQQSIDYRTAGLDAVTAEILKVASVVGPDVSLDLLRQASAVSSDKLARAVETMIQLRLLEESPGTNRLEFSHGLIREALYRSIAGDRRQEIHRTIGELLLEEPEPKVETIAFHLDQAGDARAADWLIRSGIRAQRTYAWRNAAERLEAALRYLDTDGNRLEERGWLMFHIAYLLRFGQPRRSVQLLERALELAEQTDSQRLLAFARFSLGNFRLFIRDYRQGIRDMEAALPLIRDLADGDGTAVPTLLPPPVNTFESGLDFFAGQRIGNPAEAAGLLAVGYAAIGRFEDVIRMSERLESTGPDTAGGGTEARAPAFMRMHLAQAWTYAVYGKVSEAETAFETAIREFSAVNHYFLLYWIAVHELELLVWPYQTDRFMKRQRLAELADDALERASGALPMGLAVDNVLLPYLVFEGKWREARQLFPQVDLPPGPAGWGLVFRRAAAELLHGQSDHSAAWEQIHLALPFGHQTEPGSEHYPHALSLFRLAVTIALDAGDVNEAAAWLKAHDRWLRSVERHERVVLGVSEGMALRARLELARHEPHNARQLAERALCRATDPWQPVALILAHRTLGLARLASGDLEDAENELRQAVLLSERCRLPYQTAETQLALAELHATAGDVESARNAVAAVRRACLPMDATRLLCKAEALAACWESRHTAPHPNGGDAGITKRELQVLDLVADRLTDVEIGDRLYISSRTVSQHLRSVYGKLGVNNRIAAVDAARGLGLLSE